MAGIIGKKLEMTRVIHNGTFTPVTLIKVPTLTVAQIKTIEQDGYSALVIAMTDGKRTTLRETSITGPFVGLEKGVEITLDMLEGVVTLDVSSISKGKGFQGAMKRWNFS
jgi:large subunit ribosomal protein L3